MPRYFKTKIIHSQHENLAIHGGDEQRLLSINHNRLRPSGRSSRRLINRIIDANINRLKEGLRICEEIARFIIESPHLTSNFKKIRHEIDLITRSLPANIMLLRERNSLRDVGRNIQINELKRKNYRDIFFANIQRAKESTRALEEFSKLINKNIALKFKKIRYDIYELEKKTARKISALCHYR